MLPACLQHASSMPLAWLARMHIGNCNIFVKCLSSTQADVAQTLSLYISSYVDLNPQKSESRNRKFLWNHRSLTDLHLFGKFRFLANLFGSLQFGQRNLFTKHLWGAHCVLQKPRLHGRPKSCKSLSDASSLPPACLQPASSGILNSF